LELCDISGEHRPIAILSAATPFPAVAVGERFDDEGWPRLDPNDPPGSATTSRRYTIRSVKHVVTRGDGVIIARYCLSLAPFDGDRSPVWGANNPIRSQADR